MSQHPDQADLCRLIDYLDQRGPEWSHSERITYQLFGKLKSDKGWENLRRHIASLAELADGGIISTGQGYKLAKNCTEKEILAGFSTAMKKAMGTERRARRMIAYAKKHGLLADARIEERCIDQIRDELDKAEQESQARLEAVPNGSNEDPQRRRRKLHLEQETEGGSLEVQTTFI